ncbi:MAG: nickel-dependent lactate racemase [Armatimonadetes bacterium]|nr:nickel-dependent lactate racemase [Armatimonadota bacterium]
MIHEFPYSDFPAINIPESCEVNVYRQLTRPRDKRDSEIVRDALHSPIGCAMLSQEVKAGMRVTIAVDDSSRTTRTNLMLPLVLDELCEAGVPRDDITILIALGTHRPMTREEMEQKYTPEVAANYRIVNPDWKDKSCYKEVGLSSRGFPIRVHSEVSDADFVIGVGQTIAHMIAGFGGGGKIIVPGCADGDTVGLVHWLSNEVAEGKLYAQRENAVRDAIDEFALKAGLKFILNDVPDGDGHHLAGAFAGHPIHAHRTACDAARRICEVKIREKADIVVADAYPADLDFWQALKGLNVAYGAVKDGGTVILVTPCLEGASSQHDELTTVGYVRTEQIRRMVEQGRLDKCIGGNLFLGAQLLDRARAILVTRGISKNDTQAMGFAWAPDPSAALEMALARHGRSASVNVLYKASKMICTL